MKRWTVATHKRKSQTYQRALSLKFLQEATTERVSTQVFAAPANAGEHMPQEVYTANASIP